MIKKILLIILLGAIAISISVPAIFLFDFFKASGLSLGNTIDVATASIKASKQLPQKINFLLLGLDQRHDSLENTLLTDAIVFASLNTQTGKLILISIPRDLWIDSLKTKINSLYYYGQKDHPEAKLNYIKNSISDVIGQHINYALILNYQSLVPLIDSLLGVTINLDRELEDPLFPNPEFINAPNSTIPAFITVKFPAGENHLDGAKALQFVRSRNSPDPALGNDLDRSRRQIILFQAILNKLTSRQIITNPQTLGKLYTFWHNQIETDLSDTNLGSIVIKLAKRKPFLSQISIPSTFAAKGAILVHPPLKKHSNQWVFEPETGDWTQLQKFISESIN